MEKTWPIKNVGGSGQDPENPIQHHVLTEREVLSIRADYKPGVFAGIPLARKYGRPVSTIEKIIYGEKLGSLLSKCESGSSLPNISGKRV